MQKLDEALDAVPPSALTRAVHAEYSGVLRTATTAADRLESAGVPLAAAYLRRAIADLDDAGAHVVAMVGEVQP